MATGHNSAFIDEDGRQYLVYHTRFNKRHGKSFAARASDDDERRRNGRANCRIRAQGETVSDTGYETDAVVGRYFVINQGTDISK